MTQEKEKQVMHDMDKSNHKEKIAELLSHYEDGWDIFKNANKAKRWDYPLKIKEGSENVPDIPRDPNGWLQLVERVVGIIAEEKYGLEYFPNRIEVITSENMMDAYAANGLPVSYEHWSFGKSRIAQDKEYKSGRGGLAYEIVINTAPAIAYCMENNSPLMQILVIAHASFGHNNFFMKNEMFKTFTDPHAIIDDLEHMRDFIHSCEEKYGFDRVEKLLDACHALEHYAVNPRSKPKPTEERQKRMKENAKEAKEARFRKPEESRIYDKVKASGDFDNAANDNKDGKDGKNPNDAGMEENILLYMAENAPHLEDWQREIMHMVANKARYFYPQPRTQVMNEGWASFWHWTLIHDLNELDLIDDGMMMEFYNSHAGVLFQPDFDEQRMIAGPDGKPVIDPQTGQPKTVSIYNGINPYALGFAMFQDIKRICEEPTEEDRKWFPYIAGNNDWLGTLKFAMENFDNEGFIQQYLSPKLMRDFKFFAAEQDSEKQCIEILGIHDSRGYETVRNNLARQYNLELMLPRIEVAEYHERSDRHMVLQHTVKDNKPLYEKNALEVMKHMYRLWGHPIVMESVDENGALLDILSVPTGYNGPETAPAPVI